MKYGFAVIALAFAASTASGQQRIASFGPEIRPFVGVYVPMGAMRDDFTDATTLAGQAAIEMSSYWHLVGSVGWTHGHNRFAGFSKDKTYLIHYDLGAEANLLREFAGNWLWKPFAGLGVGARTYDYGADAVDTRTCTTGYGSFGSEMQRGVIAFRLEARQYLTCFESPITGDKKTRTDGIFGLGLAYHIRSRR